MEGGDPTSMVYETPWPAYALAWSLRPDPRFRLAVCSCLEQEANRLQIVQLNEETKRLELQAEVEHSFPATKVMFMPDDGREGGHADLLASTGTVLNIWKMADGKLTHQSKLANTRSQQAAAPLTSFDWSTANSHKLGVSSVDTTCTIWNLEQQKIETQLIAHDKAVYDIAFLHTTDNLFASVGADGSVRLFDQRNLDHSTIVYEASPPSSQLLRLAWNKLNDKHIATVAHDTPGVILIDTRRPSMALATLSCGGQDATCVNDLAWAPHSRNHLLCGTDDGQAFIWDVKEVPGKVRSSRSSQSAAQQEAEQEPRPSLLSYDCDHEVYQVQWPSSQPDYVALGTARSLEVLQV